MTKPAKPGHAPANTHFSSGLAQASRLDARSSLRCPARSLAPSPRSERQELKQAIDLTAKFSKFRPITVSVSCPLRTPCVEMALGRCSAPAASTCWRGRALVRLGDRRRQQLKLSDVRRLEADYGALPDLSKVDFDRYVSSPGTARLRRAGSECRFHFPRIGKGLTICGCDLRPSPQALDFAKLDVVTFSWHKVSAERAPMAC